MLGPYRVPCSVVLGGGFVLKKETLEYLRGERNATRDEFILSRENAGSAEYIYVSLPSISEPIYQLWTKKARRRRVKEQGTAHLVSVEVDGSSKGMKHTGGKRPYVMVMQDRDFMLEGVGLDACGLVFKLICCGCIDWHTGRIMDKRSKESLTRWMMADKFGIGPKKIKTVLAGLTRRKVLKYDRSQRAYFINRSLVRKGGSRGENKV